MFPAKLRLVVANIVIKKKRTLNAVIVASSPVAIAATVNSDIFTSPKVVRATSIYVGKLSNTCGNF